MVKFFDTNILLDKDCLQFIEEKNEAFLISSETLKELENIKTSQNKSDEIKFMARKVIRFLERKKYLYNVIIVEKKHYNIVENLNLPISADNLIIACACLYGKCEFVSNDLLCRNIAKNIFNLKTSRIKIDKKDEYLGYKEVVMTDEELAEFYSNLNVNKYECLTNEYLVVKDVDGKIIDKYKWNSNEYVQIYNKPIKSQMFGDKIKPKDIYQSFVIDSIMTNTVTAITGKQGSGKSLLSLVCALNLIESKKYEKLVILFNPAKVKGVTDMGFYKGSMEDKAMQNFIGNMLVSKFGDRYGIDILIQQDKLKLISMADIRGMEIKEDEILYLTESQNTSSEIIKLCLGRVCEGAKVIIEGDYKSQVDSNLFDGDNNGLKKVINALTGNEIFGYVDLKHIWRSKLAELIDKI